MSVLYVGPYKQQDEWGKTAKGFVNLLSNMLGENLVIRPVWFNNSEQYVEIPELEDAERRKVEEKDILIQHGLPSHLNYNGEFKTNIAVTSIDCIVKNTDWPLHLNLFDKVIVFSEYEKELLKESGVETEIIALNNPPIYIEKNKEELNFKRSEYLFYTVGSSDVKSGFLEVLAAYLSGFSILDGVMLVVFTDESQTIEKMVEEVKRALGIYANNAGYPNIAIINRQDQAILNYAHENFNAFIDVGYNSRVSQNILNSIAYGQITIMLDTCNIINEYELEVKSVDSIPYYKHRPLPGLYSGEYTWKTPCSIDLRNKMRLVHQDAEVKVKCKDKLYAFSSTLFNLPEKLKEVLRCS